MRRLLFLALIAAPREAFAQVVARRPELRDSILLDTAVNRTDSDRHTLVLRRHVVYRATLSHPGIALVFHAPKEWELPLVVPLRGTGGLSFEIYPSYDGPVDLDAALRGTTEPARLVVWADLRATNVPRHTELDDWWQTGLAVHGGWHPRLIRDHNLTAGAGTIVGACLAARNGSSRQGILNGCVLGVDLFVDPNSDHLWGVYTEPRLRFIRLGSPQSRNEFGLLGHLEFINVPETLQGPSMGMGAGLYVARNSGFPREGSGWRWTVDVRLEKSGLNDGPYTVLQAGVGRYW